MSVQCVSLVAELESGNIPYVYSRGLTFRQVDLPGDWVSTIQRQQTWILFNTAWQYAAAQYGEQPRHEWSEQDRDDHQGSWGRIEGRQLVEVLHKVLYHRGLKLSPSGLALVTA